VVLTDEELGFGAELRLVSGRQAGATVVWVEAAGGPQSGEAPARGWDVQDPQTKPQKNTSGTDSAQRRNKR
jgi:hypothetical protein